MKLGTHSRRAGPALAAALALGGAAQAGPPLAGCYERVYDAAHFKAHKGQIAARVRLAVMAPTDPDMAAPIIAEARLAFRVRKAKESFATSGVCRKSGQALICQGAVAATETDTCPDKADGVRDCRIDWPDSAGSFRIESRPDGVLVTIPERLEVPGPDATDGLPFLYLSAGNAENRAFRLKAAPASVCK